MIGEKLKMGILLVIAGHLLVLSITYTNAAVTNCGTITAGITDDNRDKMLEVFNERRETIATGQDPRLKKAKNMYKLVFLPINVVSTAVAKNELEFGEDCFLPPEYRSKLTKMHNGLRLFTARGGLDSFNKKHLMYGVTYDCGLEQVAKKIVRGKIASDKYGVIRISKENLENPHEAIIEGINELLDDEEQLKQAIYPPVTRFGCYSEVNSGKKTMDAICVYDAKYDANFQEQGKGPCEKNDDCVYHKSSICLGGLCFIEE